MARWRWAARRDDGATLVEYSMLVALVAVASIGAIQFMEGQGEDRLQGRSSNAGAPDVNAALPPSGGDGGTGDGGTGDGGDGGPGPTVQPDASFTSATGTHGHDWSASVTITLLDSAGGGPVSGAVVTGVWTPSDGGTTTCTTNGSGQCTVTQAGMESRDNKSGYVASVTFTLTDVTGPGISYSEPPLTTPPIPVPA